MSDSTTAVREGDTGVADEAASQAATHDQLLAWLGAIDHNAEETISIAMLRDAAVLLANSLNADWYLAIAAETNAIVDVEVGPRDGDGDPEAARWQFTQDEVPDLLRDAMGRRTSTVLGDWAAAADDDEPIRQEVGLASAVVFPICDERRVIGAIGVCSRKTNAFRSEGMLLGESAAKIVAAAYTNCEAKRALEKSRSEHAALLDTIDAIVLQLDSQGTVESLNRAGEEATEFEQGELVGRRIWNSLLVPEEVESVKAALSRLENGESTISFESFILTKRSDRRRIAWSATSMGGAEKATAFLATGIDITDQENAIEQLECSRKETEEVKTQLAEIRKAFDEATTIRESAEERNDSQDVKGKSDRRMSSRRSYPYSQLIAPIVAGRLPRRAEFKELRFRDIGGGGFSFVSVDQLLNTRFVVALGAPPSQTYLAAEMVHSTPVEIDGRTQFAVGCKYTARVEL